MIPLRRLIGVLVIVSLLLSVSVSYAKVGSGPGGIDANSLDAAPADCEGTCSLLLFGQDKKGVADSWNSQTIDSNFKAKWTVQDDQWCANHGSPTNEATPAQIFSPSPSPPASPFTPGTCPYLLLPGDDCATVKTKLMRCKLKNSQIESQCQALYAAKDGINWQWTLVVIDAAAAASCLSACYLGDQMNPGLSKACTVAGVAATATEAFAILKMKNSTLMKVLSGLSAAGGATMLGRKAVSNDAKTAPAEAAATGVKLKADADNKTGDERQSACIAGYFFTALAGIRAYSIYDATQTEENACKAIQDLSSKSAVIGGGPSQIKQPDTVLAAGSGAGTTARATVSSMGQTSNGSGAPTTTNSLNPTTGQLVNQAAMADDGRLLNGSGLTKRSLPRAQSINPNEMMASMLQDPARAVSQSIGSMGNGLLPASALQNVAAISQEVGRNRKGYARDILASEGGGNYQSSGGGGGHSGSGGEKPDTSAADMAAAFSGIFGAPPEAAKPPASKEVAFPGQDSGDVWHSAAKQTSIFDIVSHRIQKITYRFE